MLTLRVFDTDQKQPTNKKLQILNNYCDTDVKMTSYGHDVPGYAGEEPIHRF